MIDQEFFFMPPQRAWTWWERLRLMFLPMQETSDTDWDGAVTVVRFKLLGGMIYVFSEERTPPPGGYSGAITEEQFSAWIEEIRPTMRRVSRWEGPGVVNTYRMIDGVPEDKPMTEDDFSNET